jgi:ketosteroid isomerase-like protein
MMNARQILEEFTASSFRDPKEAAETFAEDGAFEMPYLDGLGFPWRYEGREKVEGFFKFVRDLYPDMDLPDVEVVCETPDVVVGEYEFTAKPSQTGLVIHQLFVGRLEAENGQIKLLRESINLVELGLGIYPNGLADYKVPAEK